MESDGSECLGIATFDGKCVAHLPFAEAEKVLLEQVRSGRLDLRGVPLTPEMFRHVTSLVERHRKSPGTTLDMTFSAADFPFEADFFGWDFNGSASFHATRFREKANFGGAIFRHSAWFDGAVFDRGVTFEHAVLRSEASLADSRIGGDANLYKARFEAPVNLGGALFCNDLTLTEAQFEGNQWLGPIACLGSAMLDRVGFEGNLTLEAGGGCFDFASARFTDTVTMRLRWSTISLESVVLTRPALIASARPFTDLEEGVESHLEGWAMGRNGLSTALPRIESLRYANVEALTLANVDLRACRFAGVRNLDRLRLEGDVHFAGAPPLRAQRRVIAEEQYWRARRHQGGGWVDTACAITSPFVQEEKVQPRQLASTYRALRKSLEDSKDTPGAADFYYGEMEMRRHSKATPWFERALIWAYWILSGYGVRASRSILGLLIVVAAFGWLYAEVGFVTDSSLLTGLLAASRAALLIPYDDAPTLSHAGEAFQIGLRLLGPLLVGLTLLSIRARIKR
jgi:uncharacterized protein YjbI with pentapeptide repeats